MIPSDIKGLLFDYGGTLDTGGDHWSHVIDAAWRKAGVAVDEALFREAYVYAERELARTRHIMPHHDFRDLLEIKMRLELQWLSGQGHFPPEMIESKSVEIAAYCYEAAKNSVESAVPVLERLRELGYPMVLVSNFYGNISTVLEDFGVARFLSDIIESAVVGVRKPDPRIFLLGCKALGLPPENVLVVGDSYAKDIVPSLKAGCKAVWIKGRGWTQEEDSVEYPHTIHHLQELLQ